MSDQTRSIWARTGVSAVIALALGLVMSAGAQSPRGPNPAPEKVPASPVVEVRAPIGPRPEFYVPWAPNLPGLTAKPVLKRGGQPKYPDESIRAKEAGFTTIEFCITADGHTTDIRLASSSGFSRLDKAVLDWIPAASFSPAMFHDAPMAICGYRLVYEWRITR